MLGNDTYGDDVEWVNYHLDCNTGDGVGEKSSKGTHEDTANGFNVFWLNIRNISTGICLLR